MNEIDKFNKKNLDDGGYVLYSGPRDDDEEEIDIESLVHENIPPTPIENQSTNQESLKVFEQGENKVVLFKGKKRFSGKIKSFIYEEDEHKPLPIITVVFEVEP